MITKTYDPEQWQLVPVRPSDAMIAGMETLDWTDSDVRANCFNMWQTALAAAPQHESQWQDISTAPRGGRILVWSPDIGQCVASAGWDTETPDDIRWGVANDIYVEPTLWMPLPQHPDTGETTDRAHFGASAISSPEYLAAQNAANNRLREMMEKANTLSELPYRKMEHIRDNGDGTLTINRPIPYKSQGDAFAGERERCALIADAESAKMKITRVCEHPRTSIVWDEAYRRCDDCNASVPAEG